jgi:hypothetical protein
MRFSPPGMIWSAGAAATKPRTADSLLRQVCHRLFGARTADGLPDAGVSHRLLAIGNRRKHPAVSFHSQPFDEKSYHAHI